MWKSNQDGFNNDYVTKQKYVGRTRENDRGERASCHDIDDLADWHKERWSRYTCGTSRHWWSFLLTRRKMIVVHVPRAKTLLILLIDTRKDDRDTRAARYDIDDLIDWQEDDRGARAARYDINDLIDWHVWSWYTCGTHFCATFFSILYKITNNNKLSICKHTKVIGSIPP